MYASVVAVVLSMLIVVAVVLGLVLAFVSSVRARRAVGFTFFALGAAGGVAWGLTAMSTWLIAEAPPRTLATAFETDRIIFFDLADLVGIWDTVLASEWKDGGCRSTMRFWPEHSTQDLTKPETPLPDAGSSGAVRPDRRLSKLMMQTQCDVQGKLSVTMGHLHRTKLEGVFAVSSFPGVFSQLVVRQKDPVTNPEILVLTDRRNAWIIRKRGSTRPVPPTMHENLKSSDFNMTLERM